jgi:L-ascorbate oxidase
VKPYHYDDEKIVFLQDVFLKDDITIEQGLTAMYNWSWSGETAMVLVNGKGGGCMNETACNASLSTIDVEPGKTYRIRFIGATALTFASLAIEDHDLMQVIQADGYASLLYPNMKDLTIPRSYTQPATTSFLQIASGQRYDVLLNTLPSPPKDQYYIQVEARERPIVTRSFAILNYGSKPSEPIYPPAVQPFPLPSTSTSFLDYQLIPLYQRDVDDFPTADQVTRRVTIKVHQRPVPGQGDQIIWLENEFSWNPNVPKEPYLVSLYKNDSIEFPSLARALANNGVDNVTGTFPAEIGEVIEIVLQNTGSASNGVDAHPFHAHGHHYYDIGSGNGTYDAEANEEKLKGTSPVKRDTTVLYRYATTMANGADAGWRAWRLRIIEPGAWMIHCHILQHMIM